MVYDNSKVKGDWAEMEVMVFLTRSGYRVSIPFGENCPYDLVAESPAGNLYRVQVRWSSWKSGLLSVRLRAKSKNYCRSLDLSRIDVFAILDGTHIYLIPTVDLGHCKAEFTLRADPPKNNQKVGISMAEDYREAAHRIP